MPPPVSAAGTRAVPGRNKVTLEKGFSQVDWMRLTKTHPDLAGERCTCLHALACVPDAIGRLRVPARAGLGGAAPRTFTLAEVREHNTMEDFWTVLDGRVYNLTPYVPFHPGGQPILKQSAGRDCSALFRKYHPWVNAHFMLAKCLLGKLHESELGALPAGSAKAGDDDDDDDDDDEDDAA